jgi:ATP-dependent phosphofructokinase / diphosphate-dependent phosphofructokinase
MKKKFGVLTGGGDAPGINVAIKSIVARLSSKGHEIVGLRRGWAALLNVTDEEATRKWVAPLNVQNTRSIDRTMGSVLHTSRLNPALVKPGRVPDHLAEEGVLTEKGDIDLTASAVRSVGTLGLDGLIAIGGDGTLTFARRLQAEGVPIVAIPKTMDNDVYGTDYCIGFSTAVTRAVQFIQELRSAAESHERFVIVELFGRYSGETSLLASYLGGADRTLIAEIPFDWNLLFDLLSQDRMLNSSGYAALAVSEGACPIGGRPRGEKRVDDYGNPTLGGVGQEIADYFEQRTGERVIYQRVAYLMRTGAPDSVDQIVATNYGVLAADLADRGDWGKMVAVLGGRYATVPLSALGDGVKRVDVDRFYDARAYKPKVDDVLGLPLFMH